MTSSEASNDNVGLQYVSQPNSGRPLKGRFAPSPSGRMHLGNIFSALLSWLSVKSRGGDWVLRIEDLDPGRSRREHADRIMDDLEWLGLHWDEGPFFQSDRHVLYTEALSSLTETGKTYPCYCTRADILATQAPHQSDGRVVYPGTCRPVTISGSHPLGRVSDSGTQLNSRLDEPQLSSGPDGKSSLKLVPEGRRPSTRLMVDDEDISFNDLVGGYHSYNLARECGDFILRRSDGAWAYQLAVVVDDADMGITEVARGNDLLLSASQQIYLYRLLGLTAPSFAHVPLICNSAGQRLSKRDASLSMDSLRARMTPEQLLSHLAHLAGLTPDSSPVTPADLLPHFSWARISCLPSHILLP